MPLLKHLQLRIVLAALCAGGLMGCSPQESRSDSADDVAHKPREHAIATTPASELNLPENSASGPRAYIISPRDGARVSRTFRVVFGLSGMGVAPAGLKKDGTGHHHLLIDVVELPPVVRPLPSTENIRHFGNGQTETELTLEPGKHTLQLLLADFAHIPHSEPVLSEIVTVTVVK